MNHNPFSIVSQFAKTAEVETMNVAQADIANRGVRDFKQMALLSLGLGAAGRGVLGLVNLARRNVNPPKAHFPSSTVAQIPVPGEVEEEKVAYEAGKPFPSFWVGPKDVTGPASIGSYLPAMTGIGLLGMYGGWKGVDALLDHRRKQEGDDELAAAKRDFETALVGNYPKQAADGDKCEGQKLGEALDELYDALGEKRAYTWGDLGGTALGTYGMYGVLSGLGAGMMTYNAARKESPTATIQAAMKQRTRDAYNARPSEILAVPVPIGRDQPDSGDDTPTVDDDTATLTQPAGYDPMSAFQPKRRLITRL